MSHIKTAREMGIQRALKEAGYNSIDDVYKQAEAIGLVQQRRSSGSLDDLIAGLAKH